MDVMGGRSALKRSDGGDRVSSRIVCCGMSLTDGCGESGGVSNSGSADESLVSSENEGVLDLGVLAGESSGGVGDGEGLVDGEPSNGRVDTGATSSDSDRGLSLCANGKDARHTFRLGSAYASSRTIYDCEGCWNIACNRLGRAIVDERGWESTRGLLEEK